MLLALYATMGLLLDAVGFSIGAWQWWCFFGLFWSVSRTARGQGRIEAAETIVQAMKRVNMDLEKLYKELSK
jgi:hypothetical protein